MKKIFELLLYILYLIFNAYQLKASPNLYLTEEGSYKEASSVFFIQKDTIFQKKYDSIVEFYKKENYARALKEGLELYDNIKYDQDQNYLFLISSLIADVYDKTNNHKRALEYYKESLIYLSKKYFAENKNYKFNNEDFAKTYLRIGSSYQKISQRDSAKYYYEKVENIESLNKEVLNYKASSYGSLAGLYQLDSLFDKAILYAQKSIEINRKTNNRLSEAFVTTNLGSIYLSLNKFQIAKETYLQAIDLIKNDNSQNSVRLKADIYYNLAWAMRNLKEYKAYDYQELSYDIEDGIRDKEMRAMIEKIAMEYNLEGVKREEENKRLRARTNFWIYGISSILVMISLLYWLNYYKLKQKNLSLQLTQTQLLQNQNIEKIKSESQTRILNATIDGKESERKQIAETLHDSVSALLSSANLHLMATRKQFNGSTPIEIDKTQEIIAEASQKIRDLSHTLVSSVLLKFGLKLAINELANKYSNSALTIQTDIQNIRRYHQSFEIKVYNIIQELINNVLKHSKAENAVVKLYEKENSIWFQISDDGLGFDKTKTASQDGLGINQIEARVQMMKGSFSIESKLGEGTIIKVKLPLIEKDTITHV